MKLNLLILKDVTWASKLSTNARVSGHQRHVPARAKSVQYHTNVSVQSQYGTIVMLVYDNKCHRNTTIHCELYSGAGLQ